MSEFMVPKVLKEPLTEQEKADMEARKVTGFEKRQAAREALRQEMKAVAQGSSAMTSEGSAVTSSVPQASDTVQNASPIGSSETTQPETKSDGKIPDALRSLIPGLSPAMPPENAPTEAARYEGYKNVPDLLEDIRESIARIQDRVFLLPQKPEYPPQPPPTEPVVGPNELCSRRYGYCRTIPTILTDIGMHLRAIATVPSRQELLKQAGVTQGDAPVVSAFQQSPPPALPPQQVMGAYQQRPNFGGPRPPYGVSGGPRPPYSGPGGPRPPFQPQGTVSSSLDPMAPAPKPNSAPPPQVVSDTNDDEDEEVDEADDIKKFDSDADDFTDDEEGRDVKKGGYYECGDSHYPETMVESRPPLTDDGYYKVVTITHPSPTHESM